MPVMIQTGSALDNSFRTWMPTDQKAPALTQEQFQALGMDVFRRSHQSNAGLSPWAVTGKYVLGTGIDLADSIWATPLNPMGERGALWSMTSPDMQNFYESNKSLIEGSSAVAGGVLMAVGSEALLIPKLGEMLASSTILSGSRMYQAAKGWNAATRGRMLAAQRLAAESGDAFNILGSQAGRAYIRSRMVTGAAVAMRTTPFEYAAMWNNEAFNSGDWSREGFWIGVAAAVGGTIGAVGGRSVVRQIANSQEIRDIRAAPIALAGVSNDLLSPAHLPMARGLDVGGIELKESALTTEFLLASRSANPSGLAEAPANATRLSKLRDEYRGFAVDSIQKMISKGVQGVQTIRDKAKNLPEIREVVDNYAKQDPFIFHGMAEMGLYKGTVDDALDARTAHIKSLRSQADVAMKRGALRESTRLSRLSQVLEKREGFLMIDGSWYDPKSPLGKAVADYDSEFTVNKLIGHIQKTEGVKIGLQGNQKIIIDASLEPRNGSGKLLDVSRMELKDRLNLHEGAEILLKKLTSPKANVKFKLTDKGAENWFTLDLAAEILDRKGTIEFGLVNKKLRTLSDIKRESLRIKARTLLTRVGQTGRITPELRFLHNLPMPTPMERLEDPAGDAFRQWLIGAAKDEGTHEELSQALMDSRTIAGIDLLTNPSSPLIRTDGNMLAFNRASRDGKWLRPVLGFFDPKNRIESIMQRGHANALRLHTAERIAVLLQNQTHVGGLAGDLSAMPELPQAMDIRGLASDQVTGTGGGVGQLMGEFLPRRFRYRDNQTLLAATKLQERAEKHGLATFKSIIDMSGIQADITRITSTGGAAQRAQLDQYFSLRSGWDIKGTHPIDSQFIGFQLADTPSNRKRLGLSLGDKWDDSALLMNERLGVPVAVDSEVAGTIDKFNKITDVLRDADNVLRRAKGLKDLEHRNFYTPPPATKGALVGFVFSQDGKLVPGRTIIARSQQEYEIMSKRTLDDLGRKEGFTIRSREQLESLRDIWDEAEMDWIDPGMHAATAGIGSQKGGLTGAYVRQGAFTEALEWVKNKAVAQSQDTLRQMLGETILVSRAQGAAERALVPSKTRTIYDEYEMALTGRSQAYSDTSIGDLALRRVEESVNKILANSAFVAPARYMIDVAQRVGMDPTDLTSAKTFKAISDKMGKYTPFASAAEIMESRGAKMPPTVRSIAAPLNSMAAAVLLRWGEMSHAAMNIFGLIATMPASIAAGKAPISTFTTVKGKSIGFLDGNKIIAGAFKDMMTRKGNRDWDQMVRMGDADQSVMEYHRQLGAIDSQAGFNKWAKTIDKWASIATDTTEQWTRQYAHFVGLRMADYAGITGMAARHDFAREIANSAIADYAPINRPEVFSSGFGSMLGLFQSYALNHYTKMFRWMENGEFKKLGIQAGLQASMFGLPGTYGFGDLLDLRDSTVATGSEPTAIDLIYEHYGPILGGAIVHGGVSEVTQLALWSRGDMNFRVPGSTGTLPALDVGTKVARGFVDAVEAYLNSMPDEGMHAVIEAVQRDMPSRVLKSWLTLLNGGQEIDAYGQVMADTRTWMDTIARTIGVRSRRQQAELEAYYSGKGAMERDAARMESLRESFRSAVRNHSGKPEDVNPLQYFNDYVAAGGNPQMFRTWIRNLMRDADNPRSAKQLTKSLTTPRSALETWRYGAYGAWDIQP